MVQGKNDPRVPYVLTCCLPLTTVPLRVNMLPSSHDCPSVIISNRFTESEQMVAKLREAGRDVWYIRANNEARTSSCPDFPSAAHLCTQGHGFVRKVNTDFQFFAMVLFIQTHALQAHAD